MSEYENIDEVFREGVQKDYPFDEALWDQVESQLPRKKKRIAWVWYLNGLLLLLAGIIPFWILQEDGLKAKYSSRVNASTAITNSIASSQTVSLNGSVDNTLVKNELNQGADEATSSIQSTKKVRSEIKTDKTTLDESEGLNSKENIEEKAIINQELTAEAEKNTAFQTIENNSSPSNSTEEKKEIDQEFEIAEIVKLNILKSNGFILSDGLQAAWPKQKPNIYEKPKENWFPYLELQYRYGIALSKQLSDLDPDFEELRNNSESIESSTQFGAIALHQLGKFEIGLGIRYFQMTEEIRYDLSSEEVMVTSVYDTNYVLLDPSYNQNGESIWLIREDINRTEIENRRTINNTRFYQNQIEYLQIPASIGYNRSWNRFMAGLRLSLVMNILIEAEGGYLNSENQLIEAFNERELLNPLTLNSESALRLGYGLNEFVWLGTEYNFQYGLNSFTKNYNSRLNGSYLGLWLYLRPF